MHCHQSSLSGTPTQSSAFCAAIPGVRHRTAPRATDAHSTAMADVFSKAKRSELMSRVRSRGNKATELALVHFFRRQRITGWRRHLRMFGTPDFVFRERKIAIFVDGCFWHGCPVHRTIPATNRDFWAAKLDRNVKRDRLVNRTLRKAGWTVIRIWQHAVTNSRQLRRKLAALYVP